MVPQRQGSCDKTPWIATLCTRNGDLDEGT